MHFHLEKLEFVRKNFGVGVKCGLCRAICFPPRVRSERAIRGDVEDVSRASCAEMRDEGLSESQNCKEVDLEDAANV